MAPAKSRITDDLKVDPPVGKEKNGGQTSTKMRRGASQTSASQAREAREAREAANAPTSAPSQTIAEVVAPTLQWSSFDRDALHVYRREHQLNTPASFVSTFHHTVLSLAGGIGQYSPTMVRKNSVRRQSKDQLALAVRKHFNGLGIQENDVIVDFIYKTRNEKSFKSDGPNKQPVIVTE